MEVFLLALRNRKKAIRRIKDLDDIDEIVKYVNPMGRTILHLPAEDGDLELVSAIFDRAKSKDLSSMKSKDVVISAIVRQCHAITSPLAVAMKCGNEDVALKFAMFSKRVTVSSDEMGYAIDSKNIPLQDLFIDRIVVQRNTQVRKGYIQDSNGREVCELCEAFHLALKKMDARVLEQLLNVESSHVPRLDCSNQFFDNALRSFVGQISRKPYGHLDYPRKDVWKCTKVILENMKEPPRHAHRTVIEAMRSCNFESFAFKLVRWKSGWLVIDSFHDGGYTLLFEAFERGQMDVFRFLIDIGILHRCAHITRRPRGIVCDLFQWKSRNLRCVHHRMEMIDICLTRLMATGHCLTSITNEIDDYLKKFRREISLFDLVVHKIRFENDFRDGK